MLLPDAPPADWWIRRRGAVIRAHASQAELRCAAARTPTSRGFYSAGAEQEVRRRCGQLRVRPRTLFGVCLFIYLDFSAPGRRWCLAELRAS